MMEITDIVRRLNQMRDAQVVLRQVSISKQDMLQLREAQLNQKLSIGPWPTTEAGRGQNVRRSRPFSSPISKRAHLTVRSPRRRVWGQLDALESKTSWRVQEFDT